MQAILAARRSTEPRDMKGTAMGFVESSTEQVTAATDFLLGLVALTCAVELWRLRRHSALSCSHWSALLLAACGSS